MPPTLSLLIVRNPYLSFRHLELLLASLNQQSSADFNTFWIDQCQDPAELLALLGQQAQFGWELLHTPPPLVAGVPCWDLTAPFAQLMQHPEMGQGFVYLHMECLPEQHFVESIVSLWPQLTAHYGQQFVAMLQQLWASLPVEALFDGVFWQQLRFAELRPWQQTHQQFVLPRQQALHWQECPGWQENAFLMPTALARESGLFAAVQRPLYFQDLFDIFAYLEKRPYWQAVKWLQLPLSVIYHLQHERPFEEFSQRFLAEVPQHPELFAGFSIFNYSWQPEYDYQESPAMRQGFVYSDLLHLFYQVFRHAPQGTNHHWLLALDRRHGYTAPLPFEPLFQVPGIELP